MKADGACRWAGVLNTFSKRWVALASVLLALGCGSKGTLPDGGAIGAGGGGGGGKAGGGAGGSSADGGPAIPLALEAARMRTAGRFGTDVRFEVQAQSYAADAVGLGARFLTAAGAPALVFDRNSDGVPESAETLVAFDGQGPFKKSFAASGTLKQFLALHPAVGSAEVWLLNALGEKTFVTRVNLEPQAMGVMGMPCDRAYVDNRCADGLGCKGTPATCKDGVAPVISRVSYLRTADGPRVLLEGLDPDDDVSEVKLEFQNRMGQPVSVDLDNDGMPDSTSQTYPVVDVSSDGGYFYGIQAGPGFDSLVPRIGAVVRDIGTRPSTTTTSDIADAPVKSAGASCDLRGFNVCAQASVCQRAATSPNPTTGSCQAVSTVRRSRCTAAPVLGPATGRWTAVGSTVSPSVFDAPAGCTNNDPKGRPEGVAVLRLTAPAATVVLSTEHPGTSFDTVLYVFKGCGDQGAALDCNDEGLVAPASTLTLTNLAAGDYLVVVDSWDPSGGSYELSVELK